MSQWKLLVFGSLMVVTAQGSAPTLIPGNSEQGQQVFKSENCIQCHSVNGVGGKVGPDLGRNVDRNFTPALLASTMWNHAPTMWATIRASGIETPQVTPQGAADLFAFFYSTRFFDRPGDAGRGKRAFAAHHCAGCHGITQSLAENAPPVVKWQSLGDPMLLANQMWNHSASMREAFARRKITWQELTSQELADILVYLRNLPETRGLESKFSYTSGQNGAELFESKGCVKCHTGKLALEDRLKNVTLTDIAVDMWNHSPKMVQPPPKLTPDEMRQLLSYLWMRQFVKPEGNVERGKQVFASKRCAECHNRGANGAPQLPGQGREFSDVTIMSALWQHGPRMLNRMQQAKINWPRFNSAQQMADLIAYLNSVQ